MRVVTRVVRRPGPHPASRVMAAMAAKLRARGVFESRSERRLREMKAQGRTMAATAKAAWRTSLTRAPGGLPATGTVKGPQDDWWIPGFVRKAGVRSGLFWTRRIH